ncbi:MAG: hypothetical protein AVDCRST_MAG91-45 [uncultured Sphingomonadaceae bacterium]|uniref:Uncharacterized protein n=1 Tax=uncultured Sphingomonadaceae bacterium TaxID=169976 RepID=A0A6J4S0G1_9SPHN|nr:MAG: hypothetical protein AVDCRST_MAG91-45 [uncultured Sphingomonadaceae bacterium]
MKPQPDGLLIIQGRLAQAIDRLHADAPRMSDKVVGRALAAIERQATEHGLGPLAAVTRRGMYRVQSPGWRTALACHLERMEDACRCRPRDEAGTAAIMASIAVRLA